MKGKGVGRNEGGGVGGKGEDRLLEKEMRCVIEFEERNQ